MLETTYEGEDIGIDRPSWPWSSHFTQWKPT